MIMDMLSVVDVKMVMVVDSVKRESLLTNIVSIYLNNIKI